MTSNHNYLSAYSHSPINGQVPTTQSEHNSRRTVQYEQLNNGQAQSYYARDGQQPLLGEQVRHHGLNSTLNPSWYGASSGPELSNSQWAGYGSQRQISVTNDSRQPVDTSALGSLAYASGLEQASPRSLHQARMRSPWDPSPEQANPTRATQSPYSIGSRPGSAAAAPPPANDLSHRMSTVSATTSRPSWQSQSYGIPNSNMSNPPTPRTYAQLDRSSSLNALQQSRALDHRLSTDSTSSQTLAQEPPQYTPQHGQRDSTNGPNRPYSSISVAPTHRDLAAYTAPTAPQGPSELSRMHALQIDPVLQKMSRSSSSQRNVVSPDPFMRRRSAHLSGLGISSPEHETRELQGATPTQSRTTYFTSPNQDIGLGRYAQSFGGVFSRHPEHISNFQQTSDADRYLENFETTAPLPTTVNPSQIYNEPHDFDSHVVSPQKETSGRAQQAKESVKTHQRKSREGEHDKRKPSHSQKSRRQQVQQVQVSDHGNSNDRNSINSSPASVAPPSPPAQTAEMEANVRQMMSMMKEYQTKDPSLFKQIWERVRSDSPQKSPETQPKSSPRVQTRPQGLASREGIDVTASAKTMGQPSRQTQVPSGSTPAAIHVEPAALHRRPSSSQQLGKINAAQAEGSLGSKQAAAANSNHSVTKPATIAPPAPSHLLQDGVHPSQRGHSSSQSIATMPNGQRTRPKPMPTRWPTSRKSALAAAAVTALTSAPENAGKNISQDDIRSMLDDNPSYNELCESLEKKGFRLDRRHFAKSLLAAVPEVNSTSIASHQRATIGISLGAPPLSHDVSLPGHASVRPAPLPVVDHKPDAQLSRRGRPRKDGSPAQPRSKPDQARDDGLLNKASASSTRLAIAASTKPNATHQPSPGPQATSHSLVAQGPNREIGDAVKVGQQRASQSNHSQGLVEKRSLKTLTNERPDKNSMGATRAQHPNRPNNAPQQVAEITPAVSHTERQAHITGVAKPHRSAENTRSGPVRGTFGSSLPPFTKEQTSRKRSFSDFVDLTSETELEHSSPSKRPRPEGYSADVRSDDPPLTAPSPADAIRAFAMDQSKVPSGRAVPPITQPPPFSDRTDLVGPIDNRKALRKSNYNSKTIARDVLIASGRHPSIRGLNEHLNVLKETFLNIVKNDSDLNTFHWELVDPGGPAVGSGGGSVDDESLHAKAVEGKAAAAPSGRRTLMGVDGSGEREEIGDVRNGFARSVSGESDHPLDHNTSLVRLRTEEMAQGPSSISKTSVNVSPSKPQATTPRGLRGRGTLEMSPSQAPSSQGVPLRGTTPGPYLTSSGHRSPAPRNAAPLEPSTPSGSSVIRHEITPNSRFAVVIPSRSPSLSQPRTQTHSVSASEHLQPRPRGRPRKNPKSIESDTSSSGSESSFTVFNCKWRGCRAELHNMDTLRRHVFRVHRATAVQETYPCLWAGCGKPDNDESRVKNDADRQTLTFSSESLWERHMNKAHLDGYAWSHGDGPGMGRHDDNSDPSGYRSDSAGRQITPKASLADLVRSQGSIPGGHKPNKAWTRVHGYKTEKEKAAAIFATVKERRQQEGRDGDSVGALLERQGSILVTPKLRAALVDDEFFAEEVDPSD
ncbi:MAG: hypothetical protein M1833_007197 [Piccolia ochrophora]|nr:MAG: hypothetical protein M1833_007197 [Piccolia ochrophora]